LSGALKPALVLSGGGAIGFFHLGVAKALFEAGRLPEVIAGSSMGAMIAAGIASRSEADLERAFADPGFIDRNGLERLGVREMVRRRAFFRSERLLQAILHNVGEQTFAEAKAKSGRTLIIAVTSSARGHPTRLLSHDLVPELSICRAALASSAIPGCFEPVELDGEHCFDGSFGGDAPQERLRRHGVDDFWVSQANAWAVPFTTPAGPAVRGLRETARRTSLAGVWTAKQTVGWTPLGSPVKLAKSLLRQRYTGDLTFSPPPSLRLILRTLRNPSETELLTLIAAGEAAVQAALPTLDDEMVLTSGTSSFSLGA
jgi:TAG lipase / steryl ester hydrolase / phospholipase A2 / LPA acyltransferase